VDNYSDYPSEYDIGAGTSVTADADVASAIGNDERRMHVRAYNYWVSLLAGREFPSIQDLDPQAIEDFGPHSVIVDLSGKLNMPATPFVGSAIKAEIGVDTIDSISDVPGRSLLSRLTDHYFQIVATRAPVGFEAEFVNQRGQDLCYRGILMPFSSDGDTIDYVYGVISWKVKDGAGEQQVPLHAILPPIIADTEDERQILDRMRAEEAAQVASIERRKKSMALSAPEPDPTAVSGSDSTEPSAHLAWDDGPLADPELADTMDLTVDPDAGLADRLSAARESADICKAADGRSRTALYRALAMAYDFAIAAKRVPDDYAEILDDAGVKAQARAPMTPIVKLVFGADYDKARLTEFAAALSHAERKAISFGGFQAFVEAEPGGLKRLVADERDARRPAGKSDDRSEAARTALRLAPSIALAELPTNAEFALVLTCRGTDGVHHAVAVIDDDKMLDRAIRRAAPAKNSA
jgi:hypothetical protein